MTEREWSPYGPKAASEVTMVVVGGEVVVEWLIESKAGNSREVRMSIDEAFDFAKRLRACALEARRLDKASSD